MRIANPPYVLSVWAVAFLVVAGYPLTAFVYYPALLRTGKLDPMADTILIPMVESVVLAVAASPIVAALTLVCLRTFDPKRLLLAWRIDRQATSCLVSAAFLVPVVFLVLAMLRTPFSEFAAQDWLWTPHRITCIAWCLLLRSASLSGRQRLPASVG
jgi:hypothetical protein